MKSILRRLKGNKTRIVAISIGLLGIVQEFGPQIIPPEYLGSSLTIIATIMYMLRQATTTPIGKSR